MSIIFENSGQIDPRAITTLGVNVKDGTNPIGYFGTGLKYAICVLLRCGQGVVIHSGARVYTFTLQNVTIRGKQFQLVCMNGQELGFTTDFGKNWELWMAYRELWSNAMDENGRVYQSEELADGENLTQIVVDGTEFDQVHFMRHEFLLLDRTPIFVGDDVEVYHGTSECIFYRGIRVGRVPSGVKSRFTYNLICDMTLTEDRTLHYPWEAEQLITNTVLESSDRGFLSTVLLETDQNVLEGHLAYDQRTYQKASDVFIETVDRLMKSKSGELNSRAVAKFSSQTRSTLTPEGRAITEAEAETIEIARDLAEKLGFPNREYEIRVADDLGSGVLAIAIKKEQKMVLHSKLIADGVQHTAQAIIEESIHIRHGYGDCSRQMQTFLFEQIMRLGTEGLA